MRRRALLAACCGLAGRVRGAEATLLLTGGRIWTGDPSRPWAEAVAVEGTRIRAVGSARELAGLGRSGTRVILLNGRLVTPGFHDAHTHFLGGSMRLSQVDLNGLCDLQSMQRAVAAWADSHPKAEWITGGGWEYNCFPGQRLPRKEDLDAVAADRPVFLSAYDGHTGWANSAALRQAGIDAATRVEGFGEIVRNEKGEATGTLKEGAQSLVRRHIPRATRGQQLEALAAGMKRMASLGVTSLQNANGGLEEMSLYEELDRRGELTVRVRAAVSTGPPMWREHVELAAEWKQRFSGPMLRAGGVKFMLDGVIESHTAAMLAPYSDGSGGTGTLAWEAAEYGRAVKASDEAGIQVMTHAIGDRAVRTALDAYEKSGVTGRDTRFRVEHIETMDPADVPRFAKLGVLPCMQPIHADPSSVAVWSRMVGAERLPMSFAWRSLEKAGARLVFGSDWPACINPDPIHGLHVAVNRRSPNGEPAAGWIPEQRVSLETALRAYTSAGALAAFREAELGMIRAGMLADMMVFSQDLFRIAPARIHATKADLTIVGGRVVFERPSGR